MAKNYARRASDGRRSVSKRGQPTPTAYIAGTAALALVKNEPSRLKLVEKPLALIPGFLSVGAHSPLMGGYAVTFKGKSTWMSREQINTELMLKEGRRLMPAKQKTLPTVKAESVLLLPTWCATTKKTTTPTLATAA